MLTRPITTAGDLQHFLRGIPDNTPLQFVLDGRVSPVGMRVGYGTDPSDLKSAIVLVELQTSISSKRGAAA